MLEPILVALAAILLIIGIVGSLLPVLPGPPLSWLGLLVLKFIPSIGSQLSWYIIIMVGVFTFAITILDNFLPVWSTQRAGGSKYVVWGSSVGLVAGLWFGPLGIILGPFLGALVGGLISGNRFLAALKYASASFVGFFVGVVLKFVNLGVIVYWFVKVMI